MTPKQETVYIFLKKKNVRSGEHRTPLYVLYYEYFVYCRVAGRKKFVSPIEFGRRMSLYFKKGKSGRYAYYLTNMESPNRYKKRLMRMWYNRKWSRMRNGEKKEG